MDGQLLAGPRHNATVRPTSTSGGNNSHTLLSVTVCVCPAENLIESSPCTAAGSSHAQTHTHTHTPVHISSGTSVRLRANDERSAAHAADANRLLLKYLHRLRNLVILSNTAGVKMSIRLASR